MLIGHSLADEDGLLLAVDFQVCEIMQREERELVGMSFQALTHRDDRERNVAALSRLGLRDGPLIIRKRYVRPDGSSVWSNVQVSRLHTGDGGRLVGTIELVNPASMKRGPESLWRSAKRVDALIRRRRQELGSDIFSDYAWVILLQIYLAEAEGCVLTISDVAERCDVRPALVERWVRVLEERKLVERFQRQDYALQLTVPGIRKIERLLDWNVTY